MLFSEPNSYSASEEIPRLLWHLKVRYSVYKSTPLVPILNQTNSAQPFPHHFPKIHSNIIFSSTPVGLYVCIYTWMDFCVRMPKENRCEVSNISTQRRRYKKVTYLIS